MADRSIDVEQAFMALAEIAPDAVRGARAVTAVRCALLTRTKPRNRWLLPLSLVAGVLLAAALAVSMLPRPASAADTLAATLKANQAYKGWVHMTFIVKKDSWDPDVFHLNTENGAVANVYKSMISLLNPKTSEFQRYDAQPGLLQVGALSPAQMETLREEAAATPLNFPDMLERTQQKLHEAAVTVKMTTSPLTITETADRGMKRFDLHAINLGKDELVDLLTGAASGHLDLPSTLWVDLQSGQIRQVIIEGKEISLTYGGPDITSVYELGVPRTAKVYDNRPAKETLALCDRISARIENPMPGGVSIFLIRSTAEPAYMLAHWKNDQEWEFRNYHVDQPGKASIQVPENWIDTGADELFRRMAATSPHNASIGDAQTVKFTDFEETDPMASHPNLMGRAAAKERDALSPTRRLYPAKPLASRFGISNHLDLQASPDRPGQIALHDEWHEGLPNVMRRDHLYWLDPAHDDRPITYIESSYYDAAAERLTTDICWTAQTEFDAYATLPAPDGRNYPTHWIKTTTTFHPDKDGKIPPPTREEVTFHFFPGKTLPPLPATTKTPAP